MDHIIDPGTKDISGRGINPGDRLLIPAGQRSQLRFTGLRGEPDNPIVITNEGGLAVVATDAWCAVDLFDCAYVHVAGLELTGFSNTGVYVRRGSHHVEVDHLCIHAGAGAGIRWHTDKSYVPAGWIQRGLSIHHCEIHDVGHEAMYLGGHDGQGRAPLEDVSVCHNQIERCGYDGIQIRNATGAVEVAHNQIEDVGEAASETGQGGAGLIAGDHTTGEWHHNVVCRADRGIQLLNQGAGIDIHHNVLVACGTVRGEASLRVWGAGAFLFHQNTIVSSEANGVRTSRSGCGELRDNLIVEFGNQAIRVPAAVTEAGNVCLATMGEAGFHDFTQDDYRLTRLSPAWRGGQFAGALGLADVPVSLPPAIDVVVTIAGREYSGRINAQ